MRRILRRSTCRTRTGLGAGGEEVAGPGLRASIMSEPNKNALLSRRKYALILRRFMAGRLTTDEYEDAYFEIESRGRDQASWHIFAAAWHLYDDLHVHRMTDGHRVDGELRRLIAKWVLFLRSGAAYGGAALPPTYPESARVHASRRGRIGGGLSLVALLAAVALGAVGNTAGFAIAMAGVGVGLLTMISSGGVSLEPEAAARAFGDMADPWPFASPDDPQSHRSPDLPCGR